MNAILAIAGASAAAVFVSALAGQSGPTDPAVVEIVSDPLADGFLDRFEAALGGVVNPGDSYRYAKWR